MDHPEETSPTKYQDPTQENGRPSLSNWKDEPNRQPVEQSALDALLKWDETFYRTESKRLSVVAVQMRVPLSEIEDVVDEAWLSAVEHCAQFEGAEIKPRLHSWMQTVVFGKAVDWHRHHGCCPCVSLTQEGIEPIDAAQARRAEIEELREWLEALLEEASLGNEENLRLLHAHFFQGVSIQELARQFGLTADAVSGRIRRLEEKVRTLVEKKSKPQSQDSLRLRSRRKKK